MAKKFFYSKVYNPKKSHLIIGAIIAAVVLIILIVVIIVISSKNKYYTCSNHIIKPKNYVSVDLNGKFPPAKEYFSELACVKESKIKVDTSRVDITTIGDYDAALKIGKENYVIKIKVVDKSAPKLVAKPATILVGETYNAASFVESCSDNSKQECVVDFYQGDTDANGNAINYANYTAIGTHKIKIVAKDDAGNQSVVTTTLDIKA